MNRRPENRIIPKTALPGIHNDMRGFSLTELVVVMGIFLTVMLITASSFKSIVNQASQQSKSIETQIEGIVGLEVMRADLEQAGFGLPWSFENIQSSAVTLSEAVYKEADVGTTIPANFWPTGVTAMTFNDAASGTSGAAPRAVLSSDTTFNASGGIGSKYIVIKSTTAATNNAAKKWTTVSYVNGTKTIRTWNSSTRDFAPADRVTVVRSNMAAKPATRGLIVSPSGTFSTRFDNYSTLIIPHTEGDVFSLYGVSSDTDLRMPFNRADYYITRPASNMPTDCAPNTGVLYKNNVLHSSGGYMLGGIPLLDCVADMQIIYGLDTTSSGSVSLHQVAPLATAEDIRSQLREIRVYILAQDGKKDRFYKYPSATVNVGESFDGGATFLGRAFNLSSIIGTGWDNYRWKVYTIVVRPKNLIQ